MWYVQEQLMGIGSSTIELLWINEVLAFNGNIKVVNDGNLKNNCSKNKSQLMYNENQKMCKRDLELKAKTHILRCWRGGSWRKRWRQGWKSNMKS
jgi:hypothetical protein